MERRGNSINFNKSERRLLKKLIDRKFNIITTPKHFEANDQSKSNIERDIYEKTKESLSGSTVERMVGLTKDPRNIQSGSLKIIAEYLDFKDVSHLISYIVTHANQVNSFQEHFTCDTFIKSHKLTIQLGNNKEIIIRLMEGNKFEILDSKNTKLQSGDCVEITQLIVDYELICKNVFRKQNTDSISLGIYMSGSNNKVTSILMAKNESFNLFDFEFA